MSNYRIERLIGIGGAAVVYEARPLLAGGDGPPVACKLMREERRLEPVTRALVRQEAALGLRITPGHPNLAGVLDYFEAEDGPCIVMELVDGGSLKALCGSNQRLPFPITRRILQEVLQALAYLHGLDVLHRDLSPCNILISTTGSVKVADLGIARVMEQGHTYTKNYRGKLAYDSPEGIQTLTLDVRSDLYTLGAVLYEMLTGTPPCGEAEAFADVVTRTLRGDFAPLPPETPADLADLTMGLLCTDRDAREPRTATDALALLRRHDQPVASQAELAALVMEMKAQRGAEPDGVHRAPALAPGEMLEPGDVLIGRAVLTPGEPVPEAQATQPPVFPLPAEPPLPPLPQPPRRVTVQLASRGPDSSSSLGMRVADVAVTVVCVLALGLLLADGFPGEQDTALRQQPTREPAPVAEPAPPVVPAPVPVTAEPPEVPGETTAPRRVTQRADGLRGKPARMRSGARFLGDEPARRRPVPHASEPPPWTRQ